MAIPSERSRRRPGSGDKPVSRALIALLTLVTLTLASPRRLVAAEGIDVTVEDGLLSAELGAVPVLDVLTAIAEQTGARLSVRGQLGTVRPQAFKGVPLSEALPRVTQPNGVILQFNSESGSARRLLAIHAVAPGSPGTATKSPTSSPSIRFDPRNPSRTQLWDYEASEGLPDPDKRIEALQKLAKQRRPPLQSFTFVLAGDPDPAVRRAALGLIAAFPGEEARRVLVQTVADADPEMRTDALRALSAGKDKPVTLLAQVAKSDAEPSVRVAAIGMLDRRDGELARAVLEGARNDPDPQIREAVEQALKR